MMLFSRVSTTASNTSWICILRTKKLSTNYCRNHTNTTTTTTNGNFVVHANHSSKSTTSSLSSSPIGRYHSYYYQSSPSSCTTTSSTCRGSSSGRTFGKSSLNGCNNNRFGNHNNNHIHSTYYSTIRYPNTVNIKNIRSVVSINTSKITTNNNSMITSTTTTTHRVFTNTSMKASTLRGVVLGNNQQRLQHQQQKLLLYHYNNSYNGILYPLTCNIGSVSYFSSFFGRGSGRPPSSRLASGIGVIGAASVLFGKTKYVLAALKLTKLASLGSMVLTVGTYTMFFGFPYAVGMVGLILVHETGHAAVMHYKNVPFSPMVFVPFMGAVIAMKEHPRDAWDDAIIAAGGPALGSVGAGIVALTAHATNSQLLYALADFGFMVNLFNLLPIGSMDGGRIAGALSKWVGVGGIGLGGLLAYEGMVHNPLFYLILLSGAYETFQRFYNPYHLPPNYYNITMTQRATLTTGYIGLIITLLVAMDANQRYKKPPEVLIREKQLLEHSWDMR